MHDFLTSARQFADAVLPRIKLVDLGLALYLEYFSWPVLRSTPYVRLAQRTLLPTLEGELQTWLTEHASDANFSELFPKSDDLANWAVSIVPDDSQHSLVLDLIGRGLHRRFVQRQDNMRRANRMSRWVFAVAMLTHCSLAFGVVMSANWFLGMGWLCAMLFATVICLSNRHWTAACKISEST